MDYDLKTPCPQCPFRTDVKPFIHPTRAEDICDSLHRGQDFPCHKTTTEDDEGERVRTNKEQMCAGAMIMLEKTNDPTQMMRISERFGAYDRTKLDMDAPVYDDAEHMVERHYEQEYHR